MNTRPGGVKEVLWDIKDSPENNRFPTPIEIFEAIQIEFPETPLHDLAVIPAGGGNAIILMLKRYA